jgi:hypothetical protein
MLRWTQVATLTMMQKNSPTSSLCWRSTPLPLGIQCPLKLSGCACSTSTLVPYFTSTLTAESSLLRTGISLLTCSGHLFPLSLPSSMTEIPENGTHDSPTVLTSAKMSFRFLCCPSFCLVPRPLLHLLRALKSQEEGQFYRALKKN